MRTRTIIILTAGILVASFFLIRSYILTTTRSEAQALVLTVPGDNRVDAAAPGTLSLLLDHDKVFAYAGTQVDAGTVYRYADIRKVVREHVAKHGPRTHILIKAGENAGYKNTVAILEEMTINNIEHYAVVDPSAVESGILAKQN